MHAAPGRATLPYSTISAGTTTARPERCGRFCLDVVRAFQPAGGFVDAGSMARSVGRPSPPPFSTPPRHAIQGSGVFFSHAGMQGV